MKHLCGTISSKPAPRAPLSWQIEEQSGMTAMNLHYAASLIYPLLEHFSRALLKAITRVSASPLHPE